VVDVAHLDDAVAQLQREVSVERLASTRGVHLKARQGVLTGPCPFHVAGDHMIAVDAKANTWSCGGCGVDGGGPVEWTMKAEGVSRRHATQLLGADHDIGTGKVVRKSTVKKLDDVFGHEMDDDALMSAVVLYYHRTLKDSPEALAYLASRGLDDREIIERLKLGFANRTLGYRIPDKSRRDGAELRGRLQRIGIFRDSGHETLSGSVVVPIFDSDGARVVGMYGRKITPNLRQGTPLHLYVHEEPPLRRRRVEDLGHRGEANTERVPLVERHDHVLQRTEEPNGREGVREVSLRPRWAPRHGHGPVAPRGGECRMRSPTTKA
jgi:DNA primase